MPYPRNRRQEEREKTSKKQKKKDCWQRDKSEDFSSIEPHKDRNGYVQSRRCDKENIPF
jgi:hypothetical protein